MISTGQSVVSIKSTYNLDRSTRSRDQSTYCLDRSTNDFDRSVCDLDRVDLLFRSADLSLRPGRFIISTYTPMIMISTGQPIGSNRSTYWFE